MKTNIFIPKIIKVGFQSRNDTYTQKLAYVIYVDEKGKVRKEASWSSWRDKKIDPVDYSNEPTSGFVLNKKAGGYSTGWNHRQTYTRVYDPRGFEFEITIPNLLYILENTNSIKGKGLEGDFVYGWSGSDLILVPTDSPDYVELSKLNDILHSHEHIKSKDLILGATYKTKDSEEWIFLGRFDKYDSDKNKGKHYYFYRTKVEDYWANRFSYRIETIKSLGNKVVECLSEECVVNYAELLDKLEHTSVYSPYDESKDVYVEYSLMDFVEGMKNRHSYSNIYRNLDSPERINVEKSYSDEELWNVSLPVTLTHDWGYRRGQSYVEYKRSFTGTLEEVFEKYQPIYKDTYLANGKLYETGNRNGEH